MNVSLNGKFPRSGPADQQDPLRLAGANQVGILVLGMHRAGTSALTRMLNLLGCALPRNLLGGDQANPGGHWESEPICRFNDELLALAGSKWDDWLPIGEGFFSAPGYPALVARGAELLRDEFGQAPLFVFKDPRNCRLARFWLDVFAKQAISLAVVIPVRNPLAVARSLKTRNKADEHYSPLLWLRHVLEAEAVSRGRPRVFTSYDQMIDCWEVVAGNLQQGLGIAFPRMSASTQEEIDTFIDKRHRHEIASPEAINNDPVVSGWLRRTWEILHRWAMDGENDQDYAELDAIMRGFNGAAPAFARLILRGTEARHRADELELALAESLARSADSAAQTAQQFGSEQEALAKELREATDRLAQHADRVAEQDSALIQRREENEQAWAALLLEQATCADLRSQIVDFTQREDSLRQRLAEADAWVFRLAGERLAAQQRLKKAAKVEAQFARAAALDAIRIGELAGTQAQLQQRTEQINVLSHLLQQAEAADASRLKELTSAHAQLQERTEEVSALSQSLRRAELRATAAEGARAHDSEPAAKYVEMDARLHRLLSEKEETETRLQERFGELARLTSMMRQQEIEANRQKQHAEWLRQISATLVTRSWWWALMPEPWQRRRESRRLETRGLFDADAYLTAHPDVRNSGMDPLRHYLLHGYAEGRLPAAVQLRPNSVKQ